MPGHLWIQHIPAETYVVVKSPCTIFVSNACLAYQLPNRRDRGSLRLGFANSTHVPCIASFTKDTCEQVCLELVLEPNVEYAFNVTGPFPIDLMGCFGADKPCPDERPRSAITSGANLTSTNSTCERLPGEPTVQRKRKALEDDDAEQEVGSSKTVKSRKIAPHDQPHNPKGKSSSSGQRPHDGAQASIRTSSGHTNAGPSKRGAFSSMFGSSVAAARSSG